MEALRAQDPAAVGPYRIKGRLGTGGMGVVFLGVGRDGAPVAIKMIRGELAGDAEFRARFTREAIAASRVDSPFTALVADADLDCRQPWMATEYVPGPSLQSRVTLGGALRLRELAEVGAGIASGLAAIHGAGLVHRDVKPSNIILSAGGPRIIDFGIAYMQEATTLTRTEMMIGSPGFLSPEQVRGAKVTPASDVFSLGATLVHAATGRTPFGSGPPEVLLYRVVHEQPDLAGVPPPIGRVVQSCLAKNPRSRPSADEVHAEFETLVRRRRATPAPGANGSGGTGGGAAAAPAAPRPPARGPARVPGARRRALLGRLVIFAVATGAAALLITFVPRVFGGSGGGAPPATPSLTPAARRAGAEPARSTLSAAPRPVSAAPAADSALGPAGPQNAALEAVDWPNLGLYRDFSAGSAPIALSDGNGMAGGDPVLLTAEMPVSLGGRAAMVVILTKQPPAGGVGYHLVHVFAFTGSGPVLLGGTASAMDPTATTQWRLDGSTLLREQDYPSGPGNTAVTPVETRYAISIDGTVTDLGAAAP